MTREERAAELMPGVKNFTKTELETLLAEGTIHLQDCLELLYAQRELISDLLMKLEGRKLGKPVLNNYKTETILDFVDTELAEIKEDLVSAAPYKYSTN